MPDIIYRRNLPHIHPDGIPLFITFRLADSLPIEIIQNLKEERERESKSRSNKLELYNIEERYFERYDDWFDRCASGPHWLEDEKIANIVNDQIWKMNDLRYKLIVYCIMTNHVHLLIENCAEQIANHRGKGAHFPVTETLHLLKGNTARYCNMALKRTGSFWQHESYDHFIRDEEELERTIKYILHNPVKAGLAKEWKDWKFTYVNPELGSW